MLAAAAVLSLKKKKKTTTTTTEEEEEDDDDGGSSGKSDAEKADEPVDTVWGVGRRRRGRCESEENSSDDDDDDDDAEEKEGWNDDFDNERDDEEENNNVVDDALTRFVDDFREVHTRSRRKCCRDYERRTEVLRTSRDDEGEGGKDAECRRPKIQNRYDGENRGGG